MQIIIKKEKQKKAARAITLFLFKKWKNDGKLINIEFKSPLIFTAQIVYNDKISSSQKFILL